MTTCSDHLKIFDLLTMVQRLYGHNIEGVDRGGGVRGWRVRNRGWRVRNRGWRGREAGVEGAGSGDRGGGEPGKIGAGN